MAGAGSGRALTYLSKLVRTVQAGRDARVCVMRRVLFRVATGLDLEPFRHLLVLAGPHHRRAPGQPRAT